MRNTQAKPELIAKYGRCPVCGMALWPDGTCTLPLHTAQRDEEPPSAGVVPIQTKPKPEVEIVSTGTIDATLSVVQPDGTMSEPVPFPVPADVDPETGEIPGSFQPTLDDALFRPYRVATVRMNFSGAASRTLDELDAYTYHMGLKPGARVEVTLAGYVCGAGLKFKKHSEDHEANVNINLDDLLVLRLGSGHLPDDDGEDQEPLDE